MAKCGLQECVKHLLKAITKAKLLMVMITFSCSPFLSIAFLVSTLEEDFPFLADVYKEAGSGITVTTFLNYSCILARIWQHVMYRHTGVMIQYIAIHFNTIFMVIYCFIGAYICLS